MAAMKGPFAGFAKNRDPMLRVMRKHRDAAYDINPRFCPTDLLRAAREDWDQALELGEQFGYRNAQATVLAPTGEVPGGASVSRASGLMRTRARPGSSST
jgi:ribonucleoside-diphosphate reductase alpha chain